MGEQALLRQSKRVELPGSAPLDANVALTASIHA
jgi:hypothetical protein